MTNIASENGHYSEFSPKDCYFPWLRFFTNGYVTLCIHTWLAEAQKWGIIEFLCRNGRKSTALSANADGSCLSRRVAAKLLYHCLNFQGLLLFFFNFLMLHLVFQRRVTYADNKTRFCSTTSNSQRPAAQVAQFGAGIERRSSEHGQNGF